MNERKPVIKRHGAFKLSEMKSGELYIGGKTANFRIVKSLGKRYLLLDNEAIGFSNFNELWNKLREMGVRVITAYDKYEKAHAIIML